LVKDDHHHGVGDGYQILCPIVAPPVVAAITDSGTNGEDGQCQHIDGSVMVVVKASNVFRYLENQMLSLVVWREVHCDRVSFLLLHLTKTLFQLIIFAPAAREREHQDVDRQCEKQHGKRGEVAFALAVEDFDNHRAGTGEEVLEREPNAAVVAEDGGEEVLEDELHRETARVGFLSALGAELAFELGAAVEAFCGVVGFAIDDLGLGLRSGLYFVFHDD